MQRSGRTPSGSRAVLFQSPFHRVNGCNSAVSRKPCGSRHSFNPLFIGSKDATSQLWTANIRSLSGFNPLFIGSKDATTDMFSHIHNGLTFQSPFHRVKGCNCSDILSCGQQCLCVSIPFSSGQRMQLLEMMHSCSRNSVSIPFSSGQRMQRRFSLRRVQQMLCFNPLFIGSKDATLWKLLEQEAYNCFNPLFIGSKDATVPAPCGLPYKASFNPLFIGSKDATRLFSIFLMCGECGFNPLFIGSKDATPCEYTDCPHLEPGFQSPFHRVKGCNP